MIFSLKNLSVKKLLQETVSKMQNKIKTITKLPLFKHLSEKDLAELIECGEILAYERGKNIFKAGDKPEHVFILISGAAKLIRHHAHGRDRIVHIVMKSDLFGAAVAFQKNCYPITATTLQDSSAFAIQARLFKTKFLAHQIIGKILLQQMGDRMQRAHEDLIATYDNVQKRILHFLLDLQMRSNRLNHSSQISIPLTLQNIADCIGSSVETVIRETRKLRDQNLINVDRRFYSIPHPSKIENILES